MRQHRSPRQPYENLSKIDPGLQNQVLAFRTPPRAHLAHSFWRPDFSRILGCLPGCLARSIFRAWLNSSLEASNRAWRPKLEPGVRNSQVDASSQKHKSRKQARPANRALKHKLEPPSQERKSRPQAKTASRAFKHELAPPSLNGKFGLKTLKRRTLGWFPDLAVGEGGGEKENKYKINFNIEIQLST